MEISEEDIQKLRAYADACIVDRMRIISLKGPYFNYEYKLAELCEKYGVNVESKLGVTNFLSDCLKPEKWMLEPK